MVIEVNFPRGGKKPPVHKTAKVSKVKYDLFSNKKKTKPRRVDLRNEMGPKNFIEKTVCPEQITNVSADLLSYQSLKEGMVILGCIREVHKMNLTILLPGRLSGKVMITQISSPYTKLLEKIANNEVPEEYRQVRTMFKPGKFVSVKVMSLQGDDEKCHVNLSMCPHDINADLSFKTVAPEMLLWGAVSSCEEYGYVIDLGVKNCRAFLPKANTEREYSCGEPLWCVVQKCNVIGGASTATITTLKEKIESTKIVKETSLDYLFPGMQMNVTVNKILTNGLEVSFLDNYTGYVHESYLQNIFDKATSYKTGQVMSARVMYIVPVTKLAFFTLRSLEFSESSLMNDGTVLNCAVLGTTRGGLYVKLQKVHKGFISFRRLKTKLSSNSDLDYNDRVKKTYPIESQHLCRILSYDCLEKIYICTMEKDLINEKIFSYKDLNLGDELTVEIREVQPKGLLIQAGRIEGYIFNEHLTDTVLSNYSNVKTKFHQGQKIKARILNINEETSTLHLTLKPLLISAQNIITSYETAEHNKQYPGMVVQVTQNGLLIKFFGNVKGWVPKSQLSFEKVPRPETLFNIGQVVNCTVIKSLPQSKKLSLSLQPPKARSQRKTLHLGQRVNVKVTQIIPNGLGVQTLDTKASGIIPSQHLTNNPIIAELILNTYKEGDIINDIVVVNVGHGVPILSLREQNLETIPNFTDLKPNDILRCSVNSINEKRLLLQSPVNNFEKLIVVPFGKISDLPLQLAELNLKKNQCLLTKITAIQKDQTILGSTQLSDVWDGDLSLSQQLLYNYLLDTKRLLTINSPLLAYRLGESVTTTIKNINKNGTIIVALPNSEISGFISPKHTTFNLKIGQELTGTIINIDPIKNHLEITINPKFINKINSKQTGNVNIKIGKTSFATVLLVTREFILVTLRGNGNRQLAYMPTRLHYNDFLPNVKNFNIGDEVKTVVLRVENGFVIVMSKEMVRNFEHARKLVKRVRTTSVNSESSDDGVKTKKLKLSKSEGESEAGQFVRNPKKLKLEEDEELKEVKQNNESFDEVTELKSKRKRKRKTSKSDDKLDKQESGTEMNLNETNEIKNEENFGSAGEEKVEDIKKTDSKHILKIEPVLSGVSNFWDTPKTVPVEEESSEDEKEEEETLNKKQKKKKLTPAERAELARDEEERLRKIEIELADAEAIPKTADQFDRLVLANPNSSMTWIKYMAFHLEATEIEKARAVARKALNTIEFREEQEKLNVWTAFLNLENRYGTKESFSTLLNEAVKMNDSLTVHLQALNILSESNKISEFLELLAVVTRRYKQEPKMWIGAAEACYKCEENEQARNLMQKAVKSLEEKQHINVIVQFAFMESRWGESARAEAILEKILASYPKRVDVWCSYIDMLIKSNRIQITRNILERAVAQKLPPKKMKTLYTKFVQFETKFGDPESVKNVRKMAEDYVKNALQ